MRETLPNTVQSLIREIDPNEDAHGSRVTKKSLGSVYLPDTVSMDLIGLWSDKNSLFRKCVRLAHQGNAEATALVALIFYNGVVDDGHDRLERARTWAEIASWANTPLGFYVLALIGLEKQEFQGALENVRKAAATDFGPAVWLEGRIIEDGDIVPRDIPKAASLYLASHGQGYILGRTSYSPIARSGALGRKKQFVAWLTAPWDRIRFEIRNRFSSRVWSTHLLPIPLVDLALAKSEKRKNNR